MRRCTAVQTWLSFTLVILGLAGCNALRPKDPLSSYALPGEIEAERGVVTDILVNGSHNHAATLPARRVPSHLS